MDFELAVMNATTLILSSHITIQGCFYHLCQSTYRKLQELGLSERYKKDEAFRKFYTMVDSLAFLPLDDVKNGMEWLKENIPTGAEDYIIYFDKTYVNGSLKKIGTNESNNIRLRRIPSVFPYFHLVHGMYIKLPYQMMIVIDTEQIMSQKDGTIEFPI